MLIQQSFWFSKSYQASPDVKIPLFFQSLVLLLKIATNRHSPLKSYSAKYSAQIDRILSLNSCSRGEKLHWE